MNKELNRFCNTGSGMREEDVLSHTPLYEEHFAIQSHLGHVGAGNKPEYKRASFNIDDAPKKQLFAYVASVLYKDVELHGFRASGSTSWAASISRENGMLLLLDTKGKLKVVNPESLRKNGVSPLKTGPGLVKECKASLPSSVKDMLPAMIGKVGSVFAPALARIDGQRKIDSFINSISPSQPKQSKVSVK